MPVHALVTGPITGRIPVDHPAVDGGFVDVTPDVLFFEHDDEGSPPESLLAVAEAIEGEHFVRGSHPVQLACAALDDPAQHPALPDEVRDAHRAEHAALNTRFGGK